MIHQKAVNPTNSTEWANSEVKDGSLHKLSDKIRRGFGLPDFSNLTPSYENDPSLNSDKDFSNSSKFPPSL